MKITVKQVINVPNKLICHYGGRRCNGLTEIAGDSNPSMKLCAYFNQYVWQGANSPYYVRCRDCINAQLDYMNGAVK